MNAIPKNEFSTHLKVYHILKRKKKQQWLFAHFILRALFDGFAQLNAFEFWEFYTR